MPIGILRVCVAAMAIAAAVRAQPLAGPGEIAAIQKAFDHAGALQPLRCDIKALQPAPDFHLRFQTGYRVELPLSQFRGPGHTLQIRLRVTPDGRAPSYFSVTGKLPDVPETKLAGEFTGMVVVGEGNYGVEVLAEDDAGRGCQGRWRVQARRNGSLRELKSSVPAGAVQEATAAGSSMGPAERPDPAIGRLTILLHAAPMAAARAALSSADLDRLEGALATLLAQMPARTVRIAIFNVEQRAILWQKDGIVSGDLDEVRNTLKQLELGTVDYRAMQGWKPPAEWIAGAVEREVGVPMPPNALIVIGPAARVRDPVPAQWSARVAGPTLLFYLQYQDPSIRLAGRGPALFDAHESARRGGLPGPAVPDTMTAGQTAADTIESLIRRWRGETLVLRTPMDLADAVRRMDTRIPKSSAAAPAPPPQGQPSVPTRVESALPVTGISGGEDPTDVLVRLRDRVLAHGRRIPNYTCVETVERDRYERAAGAAPQSCDAVMARRREPGAAKSLQLGSRDRLRLDVALAGGSEMYSWAGASRFEDKELDEWIPEGAIGTGPFAASVLSVFDPRVADFTFGGETTVEGRRVLNFGFVVPQDRSHYRVKAKTEWIITGYSGNLLVDPATAELVRMNVRSDELPAATSMCQADTELDYSTVQLGGTGYILPKLARQRFIGRNGDESENAVTFSSCREYRGQSSVTFGDGAGAGPTAQSGGGSPFELAPGLPVTIELTSPIYGGEAAAGDLIQGRLISPVGAAPAGARVEGRLMRVETRFGGGKDVKIVLRWERVEVDGTMHDWSLKPKRQIEALDTRPGALPRRGIVIELPSPGEERYRTVHVPADRPVVEGGMRTEWVTYRP